MKFDNELSVRALFLGALLSIAVAAYSAFAGLKVGGVYWPIATTSLISLAVLMLLGKTNSKEITIMQTAGSSGGLLAAGIIFTIPAAWLLGIPVSITDIFLISIVGGGLGILFSYPLRRQLIEREQLPCADGAAAASLIQAGDKGGSKARMLAYTFGIGAIFSIARDWLNAIPSYVNLDTLKINAGNFSLGSSISLVPLAGGFLIGPRFTLAWFLGAIATYFVIVPYALAGGLLAAKGDVLAQIARPLGVGIVLGAAVAYFILKGLPTLGKLSQDYRESGFGKYAGIMIILAIGILTIISNMNPLVSIVAIVGAFAMAYVGARATGEMNVDPMEIFAMLVMLVAKLFLGFAALPLVIVAAIVTIAAGMAGDMMQDLKAGYLLQVKLEHQMAAQVVGLIAASLAIGVVLVSINQAHGIGTIEFPAPQAIAVKEVIQANGLPQMLLWGILIGTLLTLITSRIGWGIVPVAFGIGLYVPIELSFPLFIGGLLRYAIDRRKQTEHYRLVAAGLIAGESLVGVALTLLAFRAVI